MRERKLTFHEGKRLVAEMASQHGVRMDVNDPAISIVLLNRLMLKRAAEKSWTASVPAGTILRTPSGKCKLAGQAVAAEFNDRVASIRTELQRDIALAGARANEVVFRAAQANRHPVMLRWAVIGTVAALALFLMGLWIGARYLRV